MQKKRSHKALLAFFTMFFIPKLLLCASPFDKIETDVKGNVRLSFSSDIDGDGRDEIVAAVRSGGYPDYEMLLNVLKIGTGNSSILRLLEVPLEGKFVFLDEGKHERKMSLFAMAGDGVYVLLKNKGGWAFRRIVKEEGLIGRSEPGSIAYFDFVRDLDGDGSDEIIFPEKEGLSIWKAGDGNFEKVSFFEVYPRFFYRSSHGDLAFEMKYGFRGSFWVPQIISVDFNGDKKLDLAFVWMDEIDVFIGSGGERFLERKEHYNLGKLTDSERDERGAYVIYSFEDLDGDGIADLVMNKFTGSLTSLRSEMEITFRKDPKSVSGERIVMRPSGKIGQGGLVKDINGDGKKDLIMASGSFNIFSIIKAILKGKIDIKFSVYLFDKEARYGKRPDYSRTLTFGYDLKKTEIDGILPDLDGDFNGDGLPDVLYSPNSGEIRVILNEHGRFYSLGDIIKQEVRTSQDYFLCDLDGNGKSDIVFYYSKGKETGRIRVLLNKL